ncbi:M23 family metallopeptidase [Arcanobacterium hippocoleae]|uniref:Murein DD-endopeptidase MepM/ murein hydrolase activator NlpD n=1 Tax=Arcanobacterium hippocoleae TaxID=149017 RepID=A0ABU1T2J7_9ACTO|nr:M23 family metallopeptidase [Arcanobacterium hippocoleae]MDR6939090.1 murein DD-endopeptidase MepM/ murein hydrolase activator NlpD [Arcanobacterium hippocoleae]
MHTTNISRHKLAAAILAATFISSGIVAAPADAHRAPSQHEVSQALFSVSLQNPAAPKLNCPLHSCRVLRKFQMGEANWDAGHRGVDLSAISSTAVFAPADGEVIHAGLLVDRNVLSIRHVNDYRSTFEPVLPLVAKGDIVKRGELVAIVTDQHCNGVRCLHWGLKQGAKGYLNPLDYLLRKRVRLRS